MTTEKKIPEVPEVADVVASIKALVPDGHLSDFDRSWLFSQLDGMAKQEPYVPPEAKLHVIWGGIALCLNGYLGNEVDTPWKMEIRKLVQDAATAQAAFAKVWTDFNEGDI